MIALRRLRNQCITRSGPRVAADIVGWLGAVQAQEYEPAKWALGLRMRDGATSADVEQAFNAGRILRTHVMRPTWHFVTPADIRWLLELTGPRVQRTMATYNRRMELDARTLTRAAGIFERALRDRNYLTRAELAGHLERAGLTMKTQRLAHAAIHAELEGVICSGPRRDRQFTYALLAERAPKARRLPRDEAMATLARRYFTSHGPATVRDFVWWSGLNTTEAKRAVEMIRARREEIDGITYWSLASPLRGVTRERAALLLPIYDEYLIAYRDRVAVPHGPAISGGVWRESVSFQHPVVIDGQVAGTWRPALKPRGGVVGAMMLRKLRGRERTALVEAAGRYGRFLGVPMELAIDRLAAPELG